MFRLEYDWPSRLQASSSQTYEPIMLCFVLFVFKKLTNGAKRLSAIDSHEGHAVELSAYIFHYSASASFF